MKRRLAAAAVILTLGVLPTTACTPGASGDTDKTLTMWNPLTGDDGAFMRKIVEGYNATNPEYPVEFQPLPEMYTKISAAANAGTLPDFAIVHAANMPELAQQGVLEPVAKWSESEPELKRENYLDVAWDGAQFKGEQYGVPLDMHGVIGYYNKDLVTQYGVTSFLDDGIVTVDELMSLKGKLPEGVYAIPPLFIPGLVGTWVYNQGSSFEGDVDVTAPEYQRAFEALVKLREAGLLPPEDADSATVFNTGKALFYPDGTWGYSTKTAIEGLNFGEMNSIQLVPENPVNLLGSHLFAQFAHDGDEAQEKGAAAFVEYVRTHSIDWADAGQVVASRDVYGSAEYAKYPQSFLTATPEAQKMLRVDNSINTSYIGAQLWERSNDIVWGRVSVEQGLKEMQETIAAKVAEAGQS